MQSMEELLQKKEEEDEDSIENTHSIKVIIHNIIGIL